MGGTYNGDEVALVIFPGIRLLFPPHDCWKDKTKRLGVRISNCRPGDPMVDDRAIRR